jgi:hypothetical protein
VSVPDGAALVLDLEGSIVDQPQQVSPLAFASGQEVIPEIAVRDLIHGRPVKNSDALANPQSLDYFKNLNPEALT